MPNWIKNSWTVSRQYSRQAVPATEQKLMFSTTPDKDMAEQLRVKRSCCCFNSKLT